MQSINLIPNALEDLQSMIAKANYQQVLCFSCACVERWLLYSELISYESERLCRSALNVCWQIAEQSSSVELLPLHLNKINALADSAVVTQKEHNGLSPQIYEDVIVATLYTLKYAIQSESKFSELTADRTRDAAFQLAQNFLRTRVYPSDTVLALYEMEIKQQYKDLQTLLSAPVIQSTLEGIRFESNKISLGIQQQVTEFWKRSLEGSQSHSDVISLWLRSLNDPIKSIRQQAVLKLLETIDPYVTEKLLEIETQVNDPDILGAIAFGFGKWREQKSISFLLRLLKNGSLKQKKIAAISLGEIGDLESLPHLLHALVDHSIVSEVTIALGKLGDLHTIDILQQFEQRQTDKKVKNQITDAIQRIRSRY